MPLYDIKGFRLWEPSEIEEWDILKAAERVFHPETYAKMIRTTDEAVEKIKPTSKSNLVWTKAGAIYGYRSSEPVEAVNHIWHKAIEKWGDTKLPLLFVGSLLMWRISLRPEQWLTDKQGKGEIDPDTGKEITDRSYWINENIKVRNTVDDLMAKFNRRT
jgi:hypothetical protein